MRDSIISAFFFFFNDTATTEIYTLSLHDALPISRPGRSEKPQRSGTRSRLVGQRDRSTGDRKSTRLNSSHQIISYAVFCLKKKNNRKHSTAGLVAKTFDVSDQVNHCDDDHEAEAK